mmetsp:Transcript_85433/g.171043  ORF Transcript_85433/g.171043 Transcript_85433/m.171043 type:complete len:439 (-) Transcript_85433:394-1710(-)
MPQSGEVWGPDPEGYGTADGALQHLRRLAEDHLQLHGVQPADLDPAGLARGARPYQDHFAARQDGGHGGPPHLAEPDGRAVGQGGGGIEGPDFGRLRQEEQRQRGLVDAVGSARHHFGHGDCASQLAAAADCGSGEAGAGAEPADGDHDGDHQRARGGDGGDDHLAVRAADLQLQNGLAGEGHLGDQPAPAHQPHLRELRRPAGDGFHLRAAQKRAGEVHLRQRPADSSGGVHVRGQPPRQRPSEGDSVHCAGAAGGQPLGCDAAPPASGTRLPGGPGAAGVAPHAAQRASATPRRGRGGARQDSAGPQGEVGRGEVRGGDLLLHAGFLLADRLQAHDPRVRVGREEPRQRGAEPARVRERVLRKGADAALGPVLGVLHGAEFRGVELQLHGGAALGGDEVRLEAGQPQGVLPRVPPPRALHELCDHGGVFCWGAAGG